MAGLKAIIKTDRSDKEVSRTGTSNMEISVENWKYSVCLKFDNESGFEILITDKLTLQTFPVIKADGSMVDWIIHNLQPEEMLEPYSFEDIFKDIFGFDDDPDTYSG